MKCDYLRSYNYIDLELLREAIDSGIIDLSTIEFSIEMVNRQKYLELHNSKLWQGVLIFVYLFV